jgi:hypothetical protein
MEQLLIQDQNGNPNKRDPNKGKKNATSTYVVKTVYLPKSLEEKIADPNLFLTSLITYATVGKKKSNGLIDPVPTVEPGPPPQYKVVLNGERDAVEYVARQLFGFMILLQKQNMVKQELREFEFDFLANLGFFSFRKEALLQMVDVSEGFKDLNEKQVKSGKEDLKKKINDLLKEHGISAANQEVMASHWHAIIADLVECLAGGDPDALWKKKWLDDLLRPVSKAGSTFTARDIAMVDLDSETVGTLQDHFGVPAAPNANDLGVMPAQRRDLRIPARRAQLEVPREAVRATRAHFVNYLAPMEQMFANLRAPMGIGPNLPLAVRVGIMVFLNGPGQAP